MWHDVGDWMDPSTNSESPTSQLCEQGQYSTSVSLSVRSERWEPSETKGYDLFRALHPMGDTSLQFTLERTGLPIQENCGFSLYVVCALLIMVCKIAQIYITPNYINNWTWTIMPIAKWPILDDLWCELVNRVSQHKRIKASTITLFI